MMCRSGSPTRRSGAGRSDVGSACDCRSVEEFGSGVPHFSNSLARTSDCVCRKLHHSMWFDWGFIGRHIDYGEAARCQRGHCRPDW